MKLTTSKPRHQIDVSKVEMNCDDNLTTDMNEVLVNKNHIALFVGKSKSGKTNLAINLLTRNKRAGVRNSYKKVYDDIIVISPSMHSSKDNPFDDLDDEKKFDTLDQDTLDFIVDFTETNAAECRNTLIFFDDVGSQLKTYNTQLALLTQKHRHLRTTFWFVAQKYNNIPTSIRANASVLYMFRPISNKELESVHAELLPFGRKDLTQFIEFVFDKKYNFLYIDLSLEKSAQPIYYKRFEKIIFDTNNDEHITSAGY